MLESNPSRTSRLETHPNGERGVDRFDRRPGVWIDFPMPLKLIKRSRREAASFLIRHGSEKTLFLKKYFSFRIVYRRRSL